MPEPALSPAASPGTGRLVLRPGLRVLPYGRNDVQIGLTNGVRLPRTPGLDRVLRALERGETLPSDPAARRARRALDHLLVTRDALHQPGITTPAAAALAAADPGGFAATISRRRRLRIAVHGSLADDGVPPAAIGDACRASGVELVHEYRPNELHGFDTGPTSTKRSARRPPSPDAWILISRGELDRELIDPLIRDGIPHTVVRAVEGDVILGPLTVPGQTCCLRCLDAHRSAHDPLYPVLAAAHHRAERRDGVSEPVDPLAALVALGWAARDLLAVLDGTRPPTWSTTVHVPGAMADLSLVSWLRHPGCGCAWANALVPSDTMAI